MTTEDPNISFCAYHPQRETRLRCNRCNKPICSECAVLTPTGYRCKDCVRNQQKVFETAHSTDYLAGVLVAGVLSFIGSLICSFLGFFTILLAPAAGVAISEVVRWVIRRRRGQLLFRVIAGATLAGALPLALIDLSRLLLVSGAGNPSSALIGFLPLIWKGLYAFLVVSTVYYRLSGIQIKR